MKMEAVIEIRDLYKQFNMNPVLKDVSLDVQAGSIIGLLGANGAGKSTLIRHVIGLYLPDKGTCTTLGCNAAQLRPQELARIGYVHQEGSLVDWMTVEQMIRYVASYYSDWNLELEKEYVSEFQLDRTALVGELSPGQRQMLAILLAIGFEPDLLLLDEPAAALDPLARRRFLDLLLGIIQDPTRTILISSHILSDVEKVIDHVIILDKGQVCRDLSLADLQQEFLKVRISAVRGPLPTPLPFDGVLTCSRSEAEALVVMKAKPELDLDHLAQITRSRLEVELLSLEELYSLVLEEKKEVVQS
ncbi:MAG: ABC transporter ATP-binding protein [Planctomycetota bacterium]|nr:MAG: ABC transporter ATP-binding protein [Planctomycetota bacterium]